MGRHEYFICAWMVSNRPSCLTRKIKNMTGKITTIKRKANGIWRRSVWDRPFQFFQYDENKKELCFCHYGNVSKSAPSKFTAAWARSLPTIIVLLPTLMVTRASKCPAKKLPSPKVTLLPTCQYTFLACAPFMKMKEVEVAVMTVVAVWKMNCESRSPLPSRVSVAAEIPNVPELEQ